MCDKSLIKLIFKAFFQEGVFPDIVFFSAVAPFTNNESKNLLKTIDQLAFFQFLAK